MDVVTAEDQVIGWVWALSTTVILAVVLVAIRRAARSEARSSARDEAQFAEPLARVRDWAWRRRHADEERQARSLVAREQAVPARHRARRQLPVWVRTLAEHGRRREPKGYGPPPPLTVVEQPTVTVWSVRDQNTVPSLINPAVGAARVAQRDRWEALDVTRAVLAGDMQAAANSEDTGLIEPVRAEVVR
jgi:hypothetical protein